MTTETTPNRESHYVTTVRSKACPAIAANIFRRQAKNGSHYLDYEINRAWKTEEREGYSTRFFAQHCEGIVEVAEGATAWIEQNPVFEDGLPEHSSNGAS